MGCRVGTARARRRRILQQPFPPGGPEPVGVQHGQLLDAEGDDPRGDRLPGRDRAGDLLLR
ncbi:hypothetical protein [Amycolatopsis magusensis]|uniref:hypothetical protein n=1 Tax=Amycolatopsis magusensis TaxID=882444 RepID=UPI0037B6E39D